MDGAFNINIARSKKRNNLKKVRLPGLGSTWSRFETYARYSVVSLRKIL